MKASLFVSPVAKIFIARLYFWSSLTNYLRAIISARELHNGLRCNKGKYMMDNMMENAVM